MIRFVGVEKDGRKVIGFRLSRKNVDRLTVGDSIVVNLSDGLAVDADILIFFGETEEVMEDQLSKRKLITAKTRIKTEPI